MNAPHYRRYFYAYLFQSIFILCWIYSFDVAWMFISSLTPFIISAMIDSLVEIVSLSSIELLRNTVCLFYIFFIKPIGWS